MFAQILRIWAVVHGVRDDSMFRPQRFSGVIQCCTRDCLLKAKRKLINPTRNSDSNYAAPCALVGRGDEVFHISIPWLSHEIGIDDRVKCGILNAVQMDSYDNYFALTKTAVSHHTYQNTIAVHASLLSNARGTVNRSGNQEMSPRETNYFGRFDYWSSTVAVVSSLKGTELGSDLLCGIHIRERCG
jgi:hypothetical protein